MSLLRYSLHAIELTQFKWIIKRFLVNLQIAWPASQKCSLALEKFAIPAVGAGPAAVAACFRGHGSHHLWRVSNRIPVAFESRPVRAPSFGEAVQFQKSSTSGRARWPLALMVTPVKSRGSLSQILGKTDILSVQFRLSQATETWPDFPNMIWKNYPK